MKIKYRRFVKIISALLIIFGVVLFLTSVFRKNIRYFVTPIQVIEENLKSHKRLRLGGVVKKNSWKKEGLNHTFVLTDGAQDIVVKHKGLLPDLFREEQTIVAEGHFEGDVFLAMQVLAKHDENYKPPLLSKSQKS